MPNEGKCFHRKRSSILLDDVSWCPDCGTLFRYNGAAKPDLIAENQRLREALNSACENCCYQDEGFSEITCQEIECKLYTAIKAGEDALK